MDKMGDRYVDYSVLDMDPETGNFEVVANYYSAKHEMVEVSGKKIHWSGGRLTAPPDFPDCGFDGSLCPEPGKCCYFIIS